MLLELLRAALGNRTRSSYRTGQAFAAGLDRQIAGIDLAGRGAGAGLEIYRHLADEGVRIGIHLLIGDAQAHGNAVAHRHRTGNRPDEHVFIGRYADLAGGQGCAVAHTGQRAAVQIQRRCSATDADTAARPGLQRQRDDGLLVGCIDRNRASAGIDGDAFVDDGRCGVVVVHVADAAAKGSPAVTDIAGLEVLQRQITGGM